MVALALAGMAVTKGENHPSQAAAGPPSPPASSGFSAWCSPGPAPRRQRRHPLGEEFAAAGGESPEMEFGKTLTIEPQQGTLADLAEDACAPFGAEVERLADGSVVATLTSSGVATDQAIQAARCALAMRLALPEARLALATGRGVVADRWPIGEVIDRAARLLRRSSGRRRDPRRRGHVPACSTRASSSAATRAAWRSAVSVRWSTSRGA